MFLPIDFRQKLDNITENKTKISMNGLSLLSANSKDKHEAEFSFVIRLEVVILYQIAHLTIVRQVRIQSRWSSTVGRNHYAKIRR